MLIYYRDFSNNRINTIKDELVATSCDALKLKEMWVIISIRWSLISIAVIYDPIEQSIIFLDILKAIG